MKYWKDNILIGVIIELRKHHLKINLLNARRKAIANEELELWY